MKSQVEKTPEELADLEASRAARCAEEIRKREAYELKLVELLAEQDVREPTLPLPGWSEPLLDKFYKNSVYMVFDVKQGEFFLFQKLSTRTDNNGMSRPVLAMCVEFDVYDQAVVIRYIEFPRTWEDKRLGHRRTSVISETVLWNTAIYVFGKWVGKPNWKEILAAYRKTFYYGQPERVNTINEILRDLEEQEKSPD